MPGRERAVPSAAPAPRPRRAPPPRGHAQHPDLRRGAAQPARRAPQGGRHPRGHDVPRPRHLGVGPRAADGRGVRRLPLGRHRQVRRGPQAVHRDEHAGHAAHAAAGQADEEAGGVRARVDGLLQLRPQRGARDGVPDADRPGQARPVRRVDGRGHGGPHDQQDPGQPAQHVHADQGHGRDQRRQGGRQPPRRHRQALDRDGGVARAPPRLGGQHERAHRPVRGRGQGGAADAVLSPGHGGGPHPGGHLHQPAHRRRLEDGHRHPEPARQELGRGAAGRGVQLRVRGAEPHQVGVAAGHGADPPEAQPLQRRALVPGRLVQGVARLPRPLLPRLPHHPRLHHGRRRSPLREEADYGEDPAAAVQGGAVPAVLHDGGVAVQRRQRAGAHGGDDARRPEGVRLRRQGGGLGRVPQHVRPRHPQVRAQG